MNLEDDDHVIGYWFVGVEGIDWLAIAVRRGAELLAEYRFRYHAPGDQRNPFDGRDTKSFYALKAPRDDGAKFIRAMDEMSTIVASQIQATTVRTVRVCGSVEDFFRRLEQEPWAHVQALPRPPGQGDDR